MLTVASLMAALGAAAPPSIVETPAPPKRKRPSVRPTTARERDGTCYILIGGTRRREFHPRHERKALGISARQQKKRRRAARAQ